MSKEGVVVNVNIAAINKQLIINSKSDDAIAELEDKVTAALTNAIVKAAGNAKALIEDSQE